MAKVSWKEIEQALEDEEPIEEKSTEWEEATWGEYKWYDEWQNRKREEECLRDERY